jgi:hypothetical protein
LGSFAAYHYQQNLHILDYDSNGFRCSTASQCGVTNSQEAKQEQESMEYYFDKLKHLSMTGVWDLSVNQQGGGV